MINTATLLLIMSYTATVDRVENDIAHIVFVFEGTENIATDIPTSILPCKVSEGDTLYIRKADTVTEIRCTEPVPSTNLDIRINPSTGEVEYVIESVQINIE